jgi:hypothetical protein
MVGKPPDLDKCDPSLRDALQNAQEGDSLCVVLLLDTGPEPPEPDLPLEDFPSRQAWQQAISRIARERILKAVGTTLEGLRSLGLDPQGWELGQVVVRSSPGVIAAALDLPGVKFAVLDWKLGLLDSLEEPLPSL